MHVGINDIQKRTIFSRSRQLRSGRVCYVMLLHFFLFQCYGEFDMGKTEKNSFFIVMGTYGFVLSTFIF